MSNRIKAKPTPPPNVAAYAKAYRCSDCTGRAERVWRDRYGIWHTDIHHDNECPVLAGQVSPLAANVAAVKAAGIRVPVAISNVLGGDADE